MATGVVCSDSTRRRAVTSICSIAGGCSEAERDLNGPHSNCRPVPGQPVWTAALAIDHVARCSSPGRRRLAGRHQQDPHSGCRLACTAVIENPTSTDWAANHAHDNSRPLTVRIISSPSFFCTGCNFELHRTLFALDQCCSSRSADTFGALIFWQCRQNQRAHDRIINTVGKDRFRRAQILLTQV